jgi:hypothetical protein
MRCACGTEYVGRSRESPPIMPYVFLAFDAKSKKMLDLSIRREGSVHQGSFVGIISNTAMPTFPRRTKRTCDATSSRVIPKMDMWTGQMSHLAVPPASQLL